ncbi:MAG: pyrroloquinoline quinone biosynthesis protein PqqB [Gemmatimonadaceae bacterium]
MQSILLGSAAGGGVPQWNCWCPVCHAARESPRRVVPRTQSSLAVSADGQRWFLCNASPDVREQIARLPRGDDGALRRSPIEGVVLTDAELDHSLGIVLLREAGRLRLTATCAVARTLERDSRLLPTTRAFAEVSVTELSLDEPAPLRYRDESPSGLELLAFAVPGDPPRFASESMAGHTVGLLIRDTATGGTCAYVPGCGALDPSVVERVAGADVLLFDGTFWSDDELITLGVGTRRAVELGHAPMSGDGGSLLTLATLPSRRKIYTHVNNTNPVLVEGSAERIEVIRAGCEIGVDGVRFEL